MKLDLEEKAVVIFGICLILFIGIYTEYSIYILRKNTKPHKQYIESYVTDYRMKQDPRRNYDSYEPPNRFEIVRERMACGKESYAKGDYFDAREDFYAAQAYGSSDALYWIRVCNDQLAEIEKLKEEKKVMQAMPNMANEWTTIWLKIKLFSCVNIYKN